jgi:hypothetical protein
MFRSLFKRGREVRELFKIHINFDDWIDADEDFETAPLACTSQQVSRRFLDFHKLELKLAFALTAFLWCWCAWNWYLELNIIRPEELDAHKAGTKCGCISPDVNANGVDRCNEWSELGPSCRPCDDLDDDPDCFVVPEMGPGIYSCKNATTDQPRGTARGANGGLCRKRPSDHKLASAEHDERCFEVCCPSDPNCKAWVDKMESDYPVLYTCPDVVDDGFYHETFSCYADAAWMTMTGTLSLTYLVTLLVRTCFLPEAKPRIKTAVPVVKEALGMPQTEEEEAIKPQQ